MNVSQSLLKPKLALMTAAVAVLLAGGAQSQDANRENANRAPASQSTQIARSDAGMQTLERHLEGKTMRASKLVGMEVQNRDGDNLGEVRDIASNSAPGQKMQLIVTLQGIVGNDQKHVALPFDEIQINADGDELYTNRTRDQLAAMPAVTLTGDTTAANRDAADRRPAQPGAAGESRSTAPASPGATAPRGAASLDQRRVGDLIGAEVVGTGGDKVGEIDDIVLSTAGTDSVRAVLQVGGLAGIGEKRISLPLNQLTVERAGNDEPTVRVALDGEALERMPEFKYEEDTAAL